MEIKQVLIKVKDVFNGYVDKDDDGVFAFGGKLAIRPPYQREFVYDDKQAEAVIHTVLKGFPLNVMYWVKVGEDQYEVLDGQQRTLSIMKFLDHKFDVKLNGNSYYWDSLPDDRYERLLNYELMIYICEGSESEKLEWFRVVNIAGERLTDQELRNSVYTGKWLSDAKRHFSKRNCVAKRLGGDYIKGDPHRQELLERALKGICEYQGIKDVTEYMSLHQFDTDADELWQYFQDVIHWIQKLFPIRFPDMQGVDWCHLYNTYRHKNYNSAVMAEESDRLHLNDEIQKPSGIYEYLLCRDEDPFAERLLHLRTFTRAEKMSVYTEQKGNCALCGKHYSFFDMEADHIVPWSKGGATIRRNCQVLCRKCNALKKNK